MRWVDISDILRGSYSHLLAIFVIAVFLLQFSLVSRWQLNFVWFAIVLGALGYFLRPKGKLKLPIALLYVALGVAVTLRVLPYFFTQVPLGYDPGLHKFLFEHPFGEQWLKSMYPLPFAALMGGISAITGSWFALVPLFIILSAATGLVLYFVVKRLYNTEAAIVAAGLFAVSIAQFQTFWFHYYKNVLGILLLLALFLFIEDNKRLNWPLILLGGLLLGIHQVAFFIFGLTYLIYVIISARAYKQKEIRNAVLNGILIIVVGVALNIDRLIGFIADQAYWAAHGVLFGGGSGVFFDSTAYFFYTVPFVPFAITGLLHAWRQHSPVIIATAVSAAVVLLGFMFHNRMIIYLDIFLMIFAALGIVVLLRSTNAFGKAVVGSFFCLALVLATMHSWQARPLIDDNELSELHKINELTEADAKILATDRYYTPWLKGYVARPIIAPGLFDEDVHNEAQWRAFWTGEGREEFLSAQPRPLYLHVGARQNQYSFDGECFSLILNASTKLYRYDCS